MLPVQCKMARAALGLAIADLAKMAGMSTNTVVRFETGKELKQSTVEELQIVLERAGIEFLNAGEAGVGVRFAKPDGGHR